MKFIQQLLAWFKPRTPLTPEEMHDLQRTLAERQEKLRTDKIAWEEEMAAKWVEKKFPYWVRQLEDSLRRAHGPIEIHYSSAPCHSYRALTAARKYAKPRGFHIEGHPWHMTMSFIPLKSDESPRP